MVRPAWGPGCQQAVDLADELRPHAAKVGVWTIPELGRDTCLDLKTFDETWWSDGRSLEKFLLEEKPWRSAAVWAGPPATANGRHRGPAVASVGDDSLESVSDPVADVDPVAFEGLLGELVFKTQRETEGNPLFVLLHLLAFFGVAIGRAPYLVTGATRHYMSLFVGLVGPTGTGRKGSAGDVAVRSVQEIDPEFTNRKIRGGLNSGAGLLYHLRDGVEKRGKNGKSESDEGVTDKRHVFLETELASVLMQGHREHDPILCQMRDLFDCKPQIGSYTKDPTTVTGGHIAIVGHCTKADLEIHLGDADKRNGTANRFLWNYGGRSKSLSEGGNVFDLLDNMLSRELDTLKDAIGVAAGVGEIARAGSQAEVESDL